MGHRVVSLLPSTTEIVVALGHEADLVGITHECDHPAGLLDRVTAMTSDMLAPGMASGEIDEAVRASVSDSHTVYALETDRLHQAAPTLVLSQSLCEVCAVSADAVADAVCTLPNEAQVLGVDPTDLNAVIDSVVTVADAIGDLAAGTRLVESLRARLDAVTAAVSEAAAGSPRPRVAVLEWPVPPFAPGHWVPDMVEMAGGTNLLGRTGEPSRPIDWADFTDANPEVIVLAFCGFDAAETIRRVGEFADDPGWRKAATTARAIYAVDGSGLFSRPGPRVVDGVETLAYLFHGVGNAPPAGSAFELTGTPLVATEVT